jgi:hypothetical protein
MPDVTHRKTVQHYWECQSVLQVEYDLVAARLFQELDPGFTSSSSGSENLPGAETVSSVDPSRR